MNLQEIPIIPIVIIGAGPAGVAAAIQFRRYHISFKIFENDLIGGLLHNANLIENYPGFPEGISGPELAALFEKQLVHFGVKVTKEYVMKLDFNESVFQLQTDQNHYKAKRILIATGTRSKPIPIEVPMRANDRVLSDIRPLRDKKGKHILIIGAGDAAFDYALNLAGQNTVTIINRGSDIKCIPPLLDRMKANKKITYIDGINIKRVDMNSEKDMLLAICSRRNLEEVIEADYLLFAIGREPQVGCISDKILNHKVKLINSRLLYYIGDVRNGRFRQSVIAAGDGLRTAMQIIYELMEEK
jgi:thioredoxin reductase (NADPH)